MVQEIITYTIVSIAFIYAIRGVVRLFQNSKTTCGSGACSCGSKSDLIKEIKKGKKPYLFLNKTL